MIELRERTRFSLEEVHRVRIPRPSAAKDFERDQSPRASLLGLVDDTESPGAESASNAKRANRRRCRVGQRVLYDIEVAVKPAKFRHDPEPFDEGVLFRVATELSVPVDLGPVADAPGKIVVAIVGVHGAFHRARNPCGYSPAVRQTSSLPSGAARLHVSNRASNASGAV
jgi:hypothetical protein